MSNIHTLLQQIATQEERFLATSFLAPCVRGGKVRTKLAGLVYTLTPSPARFEGWGLFQGSNLKVAELVAEADLSQIETYLRPLRAVRLRLVQPLQSKTWLAYPINEADFRQRIGAVRPVLVHLVTEGVAFDPIVTRFDGHAWWFESIDRRDNPKMAERLRAALQCLTPPAELHFKGVTPEMCCSYDLAAQQTEGLSQHNLDQRRLQQALKTGGGELKTFQAQADYWTVDWTTADGIQHTSAITKADLTVMSSGICLSGRDRDFDLQSLVGVIENQEY